MSQIITRGVTVNAIDDTLIRLRNANYLRARNAAGSADISVLQVNASDRILFASVPQVTADPAAANDLARKSYVDATVAATVVDNKEIFTLGAGDITNQYIDLAQVAKINSIELVVKGFVPQSEGDDYSVNLTGGAGGKTRITFLNDLATGGAAALIATDKLFVKYRY